MVGYVVVLARMMEFGIGIRTNDGKGNPPDESFRFLMCFCVKFSLNRMFSVQSDFLGI